MSLKKIEILGFKSFAEKTSINFAHAVNAIVGPNGCGKSNIVDAFLWVLGEQSARTLRGSKMQDVIFTGTSSRKPFNMAEVTLTFSNTNRFLPVVYDEVAITRRLFRDGESEYLINKQQVRLRDIQELFVHTGVGKEAFAVIGQGKVAELIGQSPLERRALFEEVAGIAHFLQKRKESQRKLELAEQNLARARDIFEEVAAQKNLLEKQALVAKQFRQQRAELAKFEQLLCQRRYKEQKEAESSLLLLVDELTHKLEANEQLENERKQTLLKKKELFKEWHEAKSQTVDLQHQLKSRILLAQREESSAKDQQAYLRENLKQIGEEISSLEIALKGHLANKDKIQARLSTLKNQLKERESEKERTQEKYCLLQEQQETLDTRFKKLNSPRFELHSQVQKHESERKRSELACDVAQEKLIERQKRRLQLREELELIQGQMAAKKEELAQACRTVDEKKKVLSECTQEEQLKEKEIEQVRKSQETLRGRLLEVQAQKKVLERLENDLEGHSQAAKALLKEAKKEQSPLFGKVFSLADVVDLDGTALARIYDAALLVYTLLDLEKCLSLCEQMKAKELSIICLELLGIKEAAALGKYLEGALLVAENWRAAHVHLLQGIKKPIWVVSGQLIDLAGVIHTSPKKEHTLFSQKRRLKHLIEQSALLEEQESDLQRTRNEKEAARQALFKKRQELDEEMRRVDMHVISHNFQLQAYEKQKSSCETSLTKQENEMTTFEELVLTLKEEAKAKEGILLDTKEALTQLEKDYAICEKELESFKKEHQTAFEEKQKSQELYEQKRREMAEEQHLLELSSLKEQEMQKTCEQAIQKLGSHQKQSEEYGLKEKQATDQLTLLQKRASELISIGNEQQTKNEALEKEIAVLEQENLHLQKAKEEVLSMLSSKKTKLGSVQEARLRFEEEVEEEVEEYSSEVEEIGSYSTSEIEAKCRALRSAIEKVRDVNLLAIDEHETVLKRHQELEVQLKDLDSAKVELVTIICDLEKESRKAFAQTFEEVRISFQKHFQTLFNGGKADLVLAERSDLLQAGVEIMAQPPGKQMRSMQLLSGGEKSLTALALLFACFEIRPAPFCILDEVDAPLDETNVERFGKLLHSFSERTQFLIITHNKRTMAIADALIGVSMQEKGVSRIIAIDFRQRSLVATPA